MTTPTTSDMITYVRRIVKTPNPDDLPDSTILEYINRFYVFDVPANIQQFCFRTNYSFETVANVDKYNLPIDIYQNALQPFFVDGNLTLMTQSTEQFSRLFPSMIQNGSSATGSGSAGPYSFTITGAPFIRGHTDSLGNFDPGLYLTFLDANNDKQEVTDDGNGNLIGQGTGSVNYLTGLVTVTFDTNVPSGTTIYSQVIPYQAGRPQTILVYNNVFTVRPVPDKSYLIECDAYLTPSAFIAGNSVTFRWMAEYLARGAAQKILEDLGDFEQYQFYQKFFKEQENKVLRRSTRQNATQRTATIYAGQVGPNAGYYNGVY